MNYIWNNRLPRIIAFPRIIAPLWCEKRNNRPRLLFEEIRYYREMISCISGVLWSKEQSLLPRSRPIRPAVAHPLSSPFQCWPFLQERIQNLEKQLREANKHLSRLEVLEQVSVILNANSEFYTVVRLQQNALRFKNRRKKNVELYLIWKRWVVVKGANTVDVATPQNLLLFNCWLLSAVSYKL